jgi:hypothetical protein
MILAKHTVYHQTELIFIIIVMWFSFTNSKNAKIQQIRLFGCFLAHRSATRIISIWLQHQKFPFSPTPIQNIEIDKAFLNLLGFDKLANTRLSQNKFRQKTQKTLKKQDQFDIFTRFFVSQLSIHCQITRQSPFGQKFNLELQIWKNDMFLARHTECRHPAKNLISNFKFGKMTCFWQGTRNVAIRPKI